MFTPARPRVYAALDLETTGLFPDRDRVVEVGAVRFDGAGNELGRFQSLVHPGRPVPPDAVAVHGITDDDLAGAPAVGDVLPELFSFLGPPGDCLLLAHNAAFDAGFLSAELGRCPFSPVSPAPYRVACTLALARRRLPRFRRHRLDVMCQFYGITCEGAHRAVADALRVKDLWFALRGPDLAPALLKAFLVSSVVYRDARSAY